MTADSMSWNDADDFTIYRISVEALLPADASRLLEEIHGRSDARVLPLLAESA
jgi:hypothetical protein